jgi:hypothetical protein
MASKAKPPVATIAAGKVLHRVHGARVQARWYGRKDASWRWDDPAGRFGVLYLGKTLVGPFAETLLRAPHDRDVLWDRVQQKRAATFTVTRALKLAKLHGEGLAWFETTAAAIAADTGPAGSAAAYATPQAIAGLVHGQTELDGVQYRSRFDNDELCIALFERADPAIALESEGAPIDKNWVKRTLAPRGYRLIEL